MGWERDKESVRDREEHIDRETERQREGGSERDRERYIREKDCVFDLKSNTTHNRRELGWERDRKIETYRQRNSERDKRGRKLGSEGEKGEKGG